MKPAQVILGISGGIAAYKTPNLIRLLDKANIRVIPLVTGNAAHFVTTTTLNAVAKTETLTNKTQFQDPSIAHLSYTRSADIFVVAPATANSIAKFAHGIADDLLSTSFLSYTGPKLVVPAMHTEMWENPATQANIQTLRDRGIHILGPVSGDLACGDTGLGRMSEETDIVFHISHLLQPTLALQGKNILISAGGTQEAIDKIRCITNHSTGQLGHAIAKIAQFYGAEVTLVTSKPFPKNVGILVKNVLSAHSMKEAMASKFDHADIVFMAAAVSDFTVTEKTTAKLKRSESLSLSLDSTEDIIGTLAKNKKHQKIVGFCLETADKLETSAKVKLKRKNLDIIVANTPDNIGQNNRSISIYSKKGLINTYSNISLIETAYKILESAQ